MSERVSPTERIRARIDELFGSGRDLTEVLEEVGRLSLRLVIQSALEAEVDVCLGKEIIRCLKRYVARQIYQAVTNPPDDLPTGPELRALRNQHRLSLTAVANAVGTTPIRISTLERGLAHDTRLARDCRTWITGLET